MNGGRGRKVGRSLLAHIRVSKRTDYLRQESEESIEETCSSTPHQQEDPERPVGECLHSVVRGGREIT